MAIDLFYKGQGKQSVVSDFPKPPKYDKGSGYKADPGLVAAANVAILLNRPLLLTGEPGTGKTQFATSLAWELSKNKPLKFETKSTSIYQDLFYVYNSLQHFHAIQTKRPNSDNPINFITFNALGRAILEGYENKKINEWLPNWFLFELTEIPSLQDDSNISDELLDLFINNGYKLSNKAKIHKAGSDWIVDDSDNEISYTIENKKIYQNPIYQNKKRRVVLIDEIDKASRDFPNDILNEIEYLYFRIPELQNKKIQVLNDHHPLVIFTSNSEKQLPDAFLRRCIYYNIPFPEKEEKQKEDEKQEKLETQEINSQNTKINIQNILEARMNFTEKVDLEIQKFWHDKGIDFFYSLRADNLNLHKKPSTAELLGWLTVLDRYAERQRKTDSQQSFSIDKNLIEKTLCVLVKTKKDQEEAKQLLDKFWLR